METKNQGGGDQWHDEGGGGISGIFPNTNSFAWYASKSAWLRPESPGDVVTADWLATPEEVGGATEAAVERIKGWASYEIVITKTEACNMTLAIPYSLRYT